MVAVRAVTRVIPGVLAGLLLLPGGGAGQEASGHPAHAWWGQAWYLDWSPLRQVADLPRIGPSRRTGEVRADGPTPGVGLFWTGRNPSGLAFDVEDGHGAFRAGTAGESGGFRSPLEPGRTETRGLGGVGWRPLGESTSVVGTVAAGTQDLDPASPALLLHSFSSTPHVLVDSVIPAMEHTFAQLQGGLGWKARGWGLGTALGYQIVEGGGRATRVPRTVRVAESGVAAGAVRELGESLRIGVHARWKGSAESLQIVPSPGSTLVHAFHGYHEPVRRDVAVGSGPFHRRMERTGTAWGGGLDGEWLGVRWTAFTEITSLDERQTSDRNADPAYDRWKATGYAFGAAAQAPRGDVLLTLRIEGSSLSGEATRHDLEEIAFLGDESVLTGALEARLPEWGAWSFAGAITVGYDDRRRHDTVELLRTELEGLAPGISAEVGHRVHDALQLSLGYRHQRYAVRAGLPAAPDIGPVARELLYPGFLLEGVPSTSHGLRAGVRWIRGGADVSARVGWDRVAPGQTAVQLPEAPQGSRSVLRLSLEAAGGGSP